MEAIIYCKAYETHFSFVFYDDYVSKVKQQNIKSKRQSSKNNFRSKNECEVASTFFSNRTLQTIILLMIDKDKRSLPSVIYIFL
jgi:hypothetical protein